MEQQLLNLLGVEERLHEAERRWNRGNGSGGNPQIGERIRTGKSDPFGSRARGDFHRTSDIDLAVSGGNAAGFAPAVEEETATLLEYDIVNLDGTVQEELRERIRKEGVTLYEKA